MDRNVPLCCERSQAISKNKSIPARNCNNTQICPKQLYYLSSMINYTRVRDCPTKPIFVSHLQPQSCQLYLPFFFGKIQTTELESPMHTFRSRKNVFLAKISQTVRQSNRHLKLFRATALCFPNVSHKNLNFRNLLLRRRKKLFLRYSACTKLQRWRDPFFKRAA